MYSAGNKPYACKVCDKSFANRGSLWVHNRRHEVGNKPYTCQYCPKAFSHSSHLNVHKRIHTGSVVDPNPK
jgi:KRAB domain-containing zinc finger protein